MPAKPTTVDEIQNQKPASLIELVCSSTRGSPRKQERITPRTHPPMFIQALRGAAQRGWEQMGAGSAAEVATARPGALGAIASSAAGKRGSQLSFVLSGHVGGRPASRSPAQPTRAKEDAQQKLVKSAPHAQARPGPPRCRGALAAALQQTPVCRPPASSEIVGPLHRCDGGSGPGSPVHHNNRNGRSKEGHNCAGKAAGRAAGSQVCAGAARRRFWESRRALGQARLDQGQRGQVAPREPPESQGRATAQPRARSR